jgi:hypothetical protein
MQLRLLAEFSQPLISNRPTFCPLAVEVRRLVGSHDAWTTVEKNHIPADDDLSEEARV